MKDVFFYNNDVLIFLSFSWGIWPEFENMSSRNSWRSTEAQVVMHFSRVVLQKCITIVCSMLKFSPHVEKIKRWLTKSLLDFKNHQVINKCNLTQKKQAPHFLTVTNSGTVLWPIKPGKLGWLNILPIISKNCHLRGYVLGVR